MNRQSGYPNFAGLLRRRPNAWARVQGSELYPEIRGSVRFYQTAYGVVTVTELRGLPDFEGPCTGTILALHIHGGETCTGMGDPSGADPFFDAGMHYDPYGCPHPYHAGDLPPIFGAGGYAFSAVLTDRFTVREIIGRTVILHASLDDFTTQPGGNAGARIACGTVQGV